MRNKYLDVAKTIAAFSVVVIRSTASEQGGLILLSLMRFAVPFFL